jgi:hypothetical protein
MRRWSRVTTEAGRDLVARKEWVDVTWHARSKNGIRSLSMDSALSRGATISRDSEKQVCVQRDIIVLTVSCKSSRERTGDSASSAKVSEKKDRSQRIQNGTDGVFVCTPLILPM